MAEAEPVLYAFNRGIVSRLGLARIDLKRQALSAEIQTNWMPRMLGSMMLRPGTQDIVGVLNNGHAKMMPFVFSTTDVLLYEATDHALRVLVPGSSGMPDTILSRVSVASVVTNGTFATNLSGWTNNDGSGALSQWVSGSYMQLVGTGFNAADEYQSVTVSAGDRGKEHALRIVVDIGAITLNIGTSAGEGSYAFNLQLGVGTHSIAFTPTGNFYIDISNATQVRALVKSVAVEAAGAVTLPTPWPSAALASLRWDQSGNVLYVASDGYQQRKILRWGQAGQAGQHSFSVVIYQPMDGPFLNENIGTTTIAASDVTGLVTLTASAPLFHAGHVGALFKLASVGQKVAVAAAGTNQWSSAVEATGLKASGGRDIAIIITGTFVGTVVLQRSIGAIGAWADVSGKTWTAPATETYNDGLDNQIIYYRIGIEGTYTSGTANCSLSITLGSITGVCRIATVASTTSATADVMVQPNNTGVLTGLGSTNATQSWWEGAWSGTQGYPTAVALHEGRLWWFGRNRNVGSVSDAYESFDDTNTRDDGPINRTTGAGPVDVVNWALSLAELLVGPQGEEAVIRSSVLGGILTPTDYVMKRVSGQGSANVPALKIDLNGIFLQRSGRRVYMMNYTPSYFQVDYQTVDLTNYVPDIALSEGGVALANPGFNWLALQRQPDTRIHAVLNDGTARVLIFDAAEDEHAWIKVQMAATLSGAAFIEDVVVLPGQGGASSGEDLVYYLVRRTVNGATTRRLERWAREDECWGAAMTKCIDAHVFGSTSSTAVISGLGHLVGETVVCWADGIDQGTFTVSAGGTITLDSPVSTYCVGLGYTAQFKSAKLAYAMQGHAPLTKKKRIERLGLILETSHCAGVQYGKDFASLQSLPSTYKGGPVAPNTVFLSWDDEGFGFGGAWDTDARLCLQASSPRPVTIVAAVLDMDV